MIAAAVLSRDALDCGRQVAIALGDQARQPVDLFRGLRRRLEFNPAADAVKDCVWIEGWISGHDVVVSKGNVWSVATDIAHFSACAAWRKPAVRSERLWPDAARGFRAWPAGPGRRSSRPGRQYCGEVL